jgi:hypothetical protein
MFLDISERGGLLLELDQAREFEEQLHSHLQGQSTTPA